MAVKDDPFPVVPFFVLLLLLCMSWGIGSCMAKDIVLEVNVNECQNECCKEATK